MDITFIVSVLSVVAGMLLYKYSVKQLKSSKEAGLHAGSRPGNNDGAKIVCDFKDPVVLPQTQR